MSISATEREISPLISSVSFRFLYPTSTDVIIIIIVSVFLFISFTLRAYSILHTACTCMSVISTLIMINTNAMTTYERTTTQNSVRSARVLAFPTAICQRDSYVAGPRTIHNPIIIYIYI